MDKNSTIISILKVNKGSHCHFCLGLETTQVEKSPIEPVLNFNSTENGQKPMAHKKTVKRVGAITHPCMDGERLCFSPVEEDSCCHLVTEKSQYCDKVSRATKS